MKYSSYLILYLLLNSTIYSQDKFTNFTKLDNGENYFSRIQKDIKSKGLGTFRDTIFNQDGKVHQVIQYFNQLVNNYSEDIWTIVAKYQFNNEGVVEKTEFWKTDNKSQICKCGTWLLERHGVMVMLSGRPAYLNCKIFEFPCDSFANKITRKSIKAH
jgi:hypothetical protein